ncbi:MAG TPA: sulfatase-like hydrolase/transferase [Clostridiaceae bacterium]|nr:sulfatase-like hydrolase/transferase [Clostridiaceae bacterium]
MDKKPNVVIIMADQLRFDALGKEYTPHINELAEESVNFRHAYCASPLCVPARGAFFTGKYPNVNGSLINPWEPLDASHANVKKGIPNLYTMMENDWDSWHIGKQHLYTEERIDKNPKSRTKWTYTEKDYDDFMREKNKRKPGGENFRDIIPEMAGGTTTRVKKYSIPTTGRYEESIDYFFDGYFTNGAINAIKNRDRDKPLLLNVMMLAPHPPLEIPEPWYSRFKEVELPENVGVWSKDQSPLQLYNLPGIIGTRYRREDWKEVHRVYMGLVSLLDDCVGRIIDALKEEGIYDDTLIIFTSDHGEMLGSHRLWQKMCMYEESVRIPLYIKFPKSYSPTVKSVNVPVSAVDVLPTLCEFLELNTPADLSGISLMPLIRGEEIHRKNIFIQYDGNGALGNFQRCVISEGYKLIVDMFKDETYLELYNVINDPQERENLAFEDKYEDKINNMLISLRRHMAETGDMLSIAPDIYKEFINKYSPLRRDNNYAKAQKE